MGRSRDRPIFFGIGRSRFKESCIVRAYLLALAFLAAALVPTGWAEAQTPAPNPPQKPAAAAPNAPSGGQQFGAWILGCPPDSAGAKAPCVLVQQISETLSRKVVFVWLMQYGQDGNLLGAFRLPSGVFVDRGLVMKMDGKGEGLKVAYTRCDPAECQAVFTISDKLVDQLSNAKAVHVAVALTNGRTADVQLDMTGFPAALAALAARGKS
jgi:invasion protein IalB